HSASSSLRLVTSGLNHQFNWIFRPPEVLILVAVFHMNKGYSYCWSRLESPPAIQLVSRNPSVRHGKSAVACRSIVGLGATRARLDNPSVDPLRRFASSKRSQRPL